MPKAFVIEKKSSKVFAIKELCERMCIESHVLLHAFSILQSRVDLPEANVKK